MGAFFRSPAPTVSSVAVMGALRRSREAVVAVEGDLDTVLDWLHHPEAAPLDTGLPDRLARRTRDAGEALSSLDRYSEMASHAIF
jgi:hypothetical protein